MHKIRCSLAAIALIATLLMSGLSFQGMASGAMANAASSRHASSFSSALVVGKSAGAGAFRPNGQCPGSATSDC